MAPDVFRFFQAMGVKLRNVFGTTEMGLFTLHQGSLYMLQALTKRLKAPAEKIAINIDRYGNTVSSSIPLLIEDLERENKLNPGVRVLASGFGVGLSIGTNVLTF